MKNFPAETKARLILILAIIFWSSAFVGIRYVVQVFSPTSLALLRYLIASICMGFIYYFSLKHHPKRRFKEIVPVMLLGIIGFAAYNIFLNIGEQQVSASIASFINGLTPVIVALLAISVYNEALNKKAYIGLFISLAGISLMMVHELHSLPKLIGVLITLLSILCGAIYSLLQKKMVFKLSAIEFTSFAIWGGTLAMLVFAPQLYQDLHHISLKVMLVILYLGIFPGAIAYLLSSYSYSQMPVAQAASLSYLIPLFSTIFAYFFLGEIPATLALIGGLIALMGAILVNRSRL